MHLTTKHRLQGVAGLAGALLFFTGDMLFNGHLGSGASYAADTQTSVRSFSLNRLFAAGLVGPLAACLCMVGFLHVDRNARSTAPRLARVLLGAALVFWVFVGATHLLWTPRALAVKLCTTGQLECLALQQAIRTGWTLASDLTAIPGTLLALLLFALVVSGRTLYPRWTAALNPGLWIALAAYLPRLPAPLGAILVGGSYNLPWIVFFAVSLLTTWHLRGDRQPGSVSRSRQP